MRALLIENYQKKRCSDQNKENIQPESEPCYLSSGLLNKDNARPTVGCENCAYLRRVEKLLVIVIGYWLLVVTIVVTSSCR